MDNQYDTIGASETLEMYAQIRKEVEDAAPSLSSLVQMESWPDSVKAMETGVPTAWRLVVADQEGLEEIVFRLQGVVVMKDLPPVFSRPGKHTKVGHLRQALTVTGLGTLSFEEAVTGVGVVESMFRRHIDERRMEPTHMNTTYRGSPALEVSNRYFTSRSAAKNEEAVPFPAEVDPKGILSSMAGNTHVHLSENEVEYLERKVNGEGEQRFIKISPSNIRVGDIVEVQVSLCAVPTGKDKYRMVGVLRCVTLLDSSATEEAERRKRQEAYQGKLKRKTGHEREMAAQERSKRARAANVHKETGSGGDEVRAIAEDQGDQDRRETTEKDQEMGGSDMASAGEGDIVM